MHKDEMGHGSWRLGRRELLARLGQLGLGAAVLSFLPGCPGEVWTSDPVAEAKEPRKRDDSGPSELRIGISHVPPGQAVDFHAGRYRGWLHQAGPGEYIALSSICTHSKCKVTFQRDLQGYKCPCHGSAFDQYGRVLRGPAKRPLERYATRVDGDAIVVELEHRIVNQMTVSADPQPAS